MSSCWTLPKSLTKYPIVDCYTNKDTTESEDIHYIGLSLFLATENSWCYLMGADLPKQMWSLVYHRAQCWVLYSFWPQGFSLASAIGHSPKIVPDVREFAVQFGHFVRDDFRKCMLYGNAQWCNSIFVLKNDRDWPNLCKLQTGSPYFTPQILIH